MIKTERVESILAAARDKRVFVVGDLMLDAYVKGRVERISPEAPVPVVHVTEESSRPGGAANVALNVQALGGQAVVGGIVGDDAHGRELRDHLDEMGICTDGVLVSSRVRTVVKTRVLAERQQLVRVDREMPVSAYGECAGSLCEQIAASVAEADGVIIEDYGKGAVDQRVVDGIVKVARSRGIPTGLDPKENHALHFEELTLATPNHREACSAASMPMLPLDTEQGMASVEEIARCLQSRWNTELLAITLGAHGMYLLGRDGEPRRIETRAREVFDVCGAGDTVIATAMLALVGGATPWEALAMANYAAGVVVGHVGAAVCTPDALLKAVAGV